MSFNSDQVLKRLIEAQKANRLAHAYLLCGLEQRSLESLALKAAEALLGGSPINHADFHVVRPESKSRRIRIEQMRDLGKNLQLKTYHGGYKVALICECERMCLGSADAANAFLKTLEEPPSGTVILLTTSEPQMILPTILSRCVKVTIHEGIPNRETDSEWSELVKGWFSEEREGPLRAYRRASLLSQTWQKVREQVESRLEKEDGKTAGEDEAVFKAAVEAEVLLGRKQSIAALQTVCWEKEREQLLDGKEVRKVVLRSIRSLEELNQSLLQNVDPLLAVERACLLIEGVIVEGM